jgi:hypothetical protein
MKKYLILALAVLVICVAVSAFACPGGGCKGDGNCAQGGCSDRMYDPAKAETVTGQVIAQESITCPSGNCQGIGVTLKTGAKNIVVHLGPQWYLDKQSVKLAAGDTVVVKGSRIFLQGENVFIAAEVTKGSEVLKLRDASGAPEWAGPHKGDCKHGM